MYCFILIGASEYSSYQIQRILQAQGFAAGMSRTRNCWDNAVDLFFLNAFLSKTHESDRKFLG